MFFSRTAAPNGTILSMEHPQDRDIQICSNEDPGITNGSTPGA